MPNKVYLDHHTATRPHPAAIEALLPFYKEHWGSTVSPHQMGQELILPLENGTDAILELCGAAQGDRFHFFSSGAEAISHLYTSHYFDVIRQTGKNHIVTTNVEEAPILMSLKRLEELDCSGKIACVNAQGQITKEILAEALRPRTSLVSLSWANGLTGVIHPIADLAEVCKENGVMLHVDASYAIGKHYFLFEDLPIDFLTFEGSLIHAPKGTAGLLCKSKSLISPPLANMAGLSVGGVAALSTAIEKSGLMFDHMCLETARLRDKLEQGIIKGFPEAVVLFQQVERLPNCCAIAFPGVISDALLFVLHRNGIYGSLGGGHCQKLMHVLMAAGIDEMLAQCALSFSLSFETTEEEIDYAIKTIVACAHNLRACSHKIVEESCESS